MIVDRCRLAKTVTIHGNAARPLAARIAGFQRTAATRIRTRSQHSPHEMHLMSDLKLPEWLLCVTRSPIRVFLTHSQRGSGTRRGEMYYLFVLSARGGGWAAGREGNVAARAGESQNRQTSYGRITGNPGAERAEWLDPYSWVVASARGRQEKSRPAGQTSG
jgi:hypothetical protein